MNYIKQIFNKFSLMQINKHLVIIFYYNLLINLIYIKNLQKYIINKEIFKINIYLLLLFSLNKIKINYFLKWIELKWFFKIFQINFYEPIYGTPNNFTVFLNKFNLGNILKYIYKYNRLTNIFYFSLFYKQSYKFFLKKYKFNSNKISEEQNNFLMEKLDWKVFFKNSKIGLNHKRLEKMISNNLPQYYNYTVSVNNIIDKYLYFNFSLLKNNFYTHSKILKKHIFFFNNIRVMYYYNFKQLYNYENIVKKKFLIGYYFFTQKFIPLKLNYILNISLIFINNFYEIFRKIYYYFNVNFIFPKVFKKLKNFKFLFQKYYRYKWKNHQYVNVKSIKYYFHTYIHLNNTVKHKFKHYIKKKLLDKIKNNVIITPINFLIKSRINLYSQKLKFTSFNKNYPLNYSLLIDENIFKLYKLFWYFYHDFSYKINYMEKINFLLNINFIKIIFSKISNLLFLHNSYNTKIPGIVKHIIVKKLIRYSKKTSFFIKYFYFFFLNFLERFLKTKVFLKIYINNDFTPKINNLIVYLTKKYFNFQISIGKGFFLNEMLYILLYMFKYKDIFIFKHWLTINLERMFFAKHKKFFYKFKLILKDFFFLMVKLFKIKGFYLSISGKISAAGNSRKKRYLISTGFSSFSGYKYKLSYTKYIIRTKTGVLGITTALSYF